MNLPFSAIKQLTANSLARTPFDDLACTILLASNTLVLPSQTFFSQEEAKRIQNYLREDDKQSFRIRHFLARHGCAAFMNIPPQNVLFAEQSFGKPYVVNEPSPQFTISHSELCCAVALHANQPIGVDIQSFFSPNEMPLAQIRHPQDCLPVCTCQEMTLLWSMKEAVVKAEGIGLRTPLEQICVRATTHKDIFLVTLLQQEYFVHTWILSNNYILALAYARPQKASTPLKTSLFRIV